MRPLARLVFSLLPLLAAIACGAAEAPAPPPAPPAPPAPSPTPEPPAPMGATPGEIGVDLAALDRSIDPCQDFYEFACGGWRKATPIPDDQPSWSRSFNVIREKNETMLKEILEKYAAAPSGEPYAKALGDFYASCMDEAAIEKQGLGALKAELAKLAGVRDVPSLVQAIAHLHAFGVNVVFTYDAQQDRKDAAQTIAVVTQSGLGLPDRDYYLDDAAKMKDIRGKYEAHVENMLVLAGDSPADAKKAREGVMRIETALAKEQMTKEERREPKKTYHRTDLAGLKQAAPAIGWDAYLKETGATGKGPINLAQPDYLTAAGALAKSAPIADWRAYARWHLVRYAAPLLTAKLVDESFSFTRVLTGTAKLPPRWKRCVRQVDAAMGEALGRPFVAATIGEEGKAVTRSMIANVEDVMKGNLEALGWMDAPTRARALDKLGEIANKVAYPDEWRNYDALKIDRASYFGNVLRSSAFERKRDLAKIDKPTDRGEWLMSPPTVNAYYQAPLNEMVFPAGVLQPPFYSNKATVAMNYGGVGMAMGHELTHGFDDRGRQFDGAGNLEDWWSPPVNAEFERRAKCVKDEYEGFAPLPDIHINGKLTLGENIADLGGVKLAYEAMKKARAGQPMTQKDRFTEDQQLFLGFAQSWCVNQREEALRLMVATNPHSPGRFRVIGSLSNLPQFAKAFSCKEGQPMVRPAAQRCEIW